MQYLDNHFTSSEARTIRKAIAAMERRVLIHQDVLSSPELTRRYCQLQLARSVDEQFGCLFLTSQHRVIAFERLFQGTVDAASVYPRVVVRRCLELNAAAVIFAHNHPSGVCEPSDAYVCIRVIATSECTSLSGNNTITYKLGKSSERELQVHPFAARSTQPHTDDPEPSCSPVGFDRLGVLIIGGTPELHPQHGLAVKTPQIRCSMPLS